MKKLLGCLIVGIVVSALSGPWAYAESKTWTGAAGDNNWNTPANWHPSGVPGPDDYVYFNADTAINDVIGDSGGVTSYLLKQGGGA